MRQTLFMMEGHSEAATACTIVPRDAVAAELPDFVVSFLSFLGY